MDFTLIASLSAAALFLGMLVCSEIGRRMGVHRKWLHTVIFAALLSLTVYVIVDVEFPRLGIIRIDSADQALMDLRKTMD